MLPVPRHYLASIDYLIVLGYMAAMIAMGFHFSKKQGGADHYYAGNRRIPSWAVGISILATLISSVTFLAYPGTAYGSNWILLVQGLMVPVVLLTIVWFIVPAYRHAIGISAYEYFEKRFSYPSRLYASLAFSIMHFTKMGTVIYLLGLALSNMTGWNIVAVILAVGAATIAYTWVGGIEAVIWTDVVQGLLLLTSAVVCLAILLTRPHGGPSAVISLAYHQQKMGLGPYTLDLTHLTLIVMILNGGFYAVQKYATDQTIVQRFLVAKDDRAAIKATLIGIFLCVPTWTMFMLIGTCLWSFYKITTFPLPSDIKADGVFPYFIMTQLPVGVTGLVLAALLAAAMSALSSDLNCLSAVVVEDYYRRLFPKATDRQRLSVGKTLVVACGAIAITVSLIYVWLGQNSILETIFDLYAIFSAGIVGLFALAFFTTRANRKGVLFGMAACVLFTAWAVLTSPLKMSGTKKIPIDLGPLNFRQHSYMIGVYSHVVLFTVGYAASLFFTSERRQDALTIYGWLKQKRIAP